MVNEVDVSLFSQKSKPTKIDILSQLKRNLYTFFERKHKSSKFKQTMDYLVRRSNEPHLHIFHIHLSQNAESLCYQKRMNNLGPSLTLRSHGARVARFHIYDWIILLALMVTDGLLNLIEPFHRFVGRDMMTDLRYPMKGNTVPFWAVPVHISIFFPNLTDQQKHPNVVSLVQLYCTCEKF
jgi:hypothetical protein